MPCCNDKIPAPPWYFAKPERQQALLAELQRWSGTRFVPNICKIGIGTDCIRFVAQVLQNVGAMQPFDFPRYVVRSGGSEMLALLRRGMNERKELFPIWTGPGAPSSWPPLLPGDVLVCSNGVANHHLSIYAGDNTLWHVLMRHGVCQANITDANITRLVIGIWRASEHEKRTII